MLILFFDSEGVIHYKYVREHKTVIALFYIQVLDRLCKVSGCIMSISLRGKLGAPKIAIFWNIIGIV